MHNSGNEPTLVEVCLLDVFIYVNRRNFMKTTLIHERMTAFFLCFYFQFNTTYTFPCIFIFWVFLRQFTECMSGIHAFMRHKCVVNTYQNYFVRIFSDILIKLLFFIFSSKTGEMENWKLSVVACIKFLDEHCLFQHVTHHVLLSFHFFKKFLALVSVDNLLVNSYISPLNGYQI